MPGDVIQTSLGCGYPGSYARNSIKEVAARIVTPTDTLPIVFGDPVVLRTGSTTNSSYSSVAAFIAGGGTMSAALFGGIALREVKSYVTYLGSGNTAPQNAFYSPGYPCDVIKRGVVSVLCRNGVATAGGAVWVRIALNGGIPAGVIGGLEAASDGGNTVQLPNILFYSGITDANGVTEVELIAVNNA